MTTRGPSYASEPQVQQLAQLIADIESGHLQIPRFQRRDILWTAEQMLDLFRSLRLGLPIGSILVWRTTRADFPRRRALGPHTLPDPPGVGGVYTYLLDGLQRLSTVYGALRGARLPDAQQRWSFYYRLDEQDFVAHPLSGPVPPEWLPLWLLFDDAALRRFQRGLYKRLGDAQAEPLVTAADGLSKVLWSYKVPVVPLVTDDLAIATLAFVRLNSGGTPMGEVDMLAALTYREDFDLRALLEVAAQELTSAGWTYAAPDTVEQLLLTACKAALDLPLGLAAVEQMAAKLREHPSLIGEVARGLHLAARLLRERWDLRDPALLPDPRCAVFLGEALRVAADAESAALKDRLERWVLYAGYKDANRAADQERLVRLQAESRGLAAGEVAPWIQDPLESVPPLPETLDLRDPRARLLVLALAEQGPRDPDEVVIDGHELLGRHKRAALLPLVPADRISRESFESAANYVLGAPETLPALRRAILQESWAHERPFLDSHAITQDAALALGAERWEHFLRLRAERLLEIETSILRRHGLLRRMERRVTGVLRPALSFEVDAPPALRSFLEVYLGSPPRPAPFGGRDHELAALERWWLSGTGPLLLVAGAGLGKTSLMVQFAWSKREAGRVLFLPISVRFGTASRIAALRILDQQLRALDGEEGQPPADAESLAAEVRGLLQRDRAADAPILLVLDGLDEAEGWEPIQDLGLRGVLGLRVRALVSARGEGPEWLARLGWSQSMLLLPLKPQGVIAVLRQMPAKLAALAADPAVVAHLQRISQGDPLELLLLLEEIDSGALTPSALPEVHDVLGGYLRTLRADGAGSCTTSLLALLALARGPLSRAELAWLCAVDPARIDSAAQQMRRLIIGDGERQEYVLRHPRLREVIRQGLSPGEEEVAHERLLAIGRHSLTVALRGEAGFAYGIRSHRLDLESQAAPLADFLPLLEAGWLRAWHQLEASHDGFLGDLAAVQERLTGPENIAQAVRAGLLFAAISSLGQHVPAELLAAVVKAGIWTGQQALALARRVPEEQHRASLLEALAPLLDDAALKLAIDAARELRPVHRAAVLTRCLVQVAEAEQLPLLEEVLALGVIPVLWDRLFPLHAMSAPLLQRLYEYMHGLPAGDPRESAFRAILPHLTGSRRISALEEVARAMAEGPLTAYEVERLLPALSPERRTQVLMRFWEQRAASGDAEVRDPAAPVAVALRWARFAPPTHVAEAEAEALHLLNRRGERDNTPHHLYQWMIRRGRAAEVLAHVQHLPDWLSVRSYWLGRIAALVEEPWRGEAMALLRQTARPQERAIGLAQAAQGARGHERQQLLQEAVAAMGTSFDTGDPLLRWRELVGLDGLALDQALHLSRTRLPAHWRAQAYRSLLPLLDEQRQQELLDEWLALARDQQRDEYWRWNLGGAVRWMRPTQLRRALQVSMERRIKGNIAHLLQAAAVGAGGENALALLEKHSVLVETAWLPTLISRVVSKLERPELETQQRGLATTLSVERQDARAELLDHLLRSAGFRDPACRERARHALLGLREAGDTEINRHFARSLGLRYEPLAEQELQVEALLSYIDSLGKSHEQQHYRRLLLAKSCAALCEPDCAALRDSFLRKLKAIDRSLSHTLDDELLACLSVAEIRAFIQQSRGHGFFNGQWHDLIHRLASLGEVEDALAEIAGLSKLREHAESDQARALSALLPLVPEEQRLSLWAELERLLTKVQAVAMRALVLGRMAPYQGERRLSSAIDAFKLSISIDGMSARAEAFRAIVPVLTDRNDGATRAILLELWDQSFRTLTKRTLPDLLSDLKEMLPMLERIGGTALIDACLAAVRSIAETEFCLSPAVAG